PRSVPTRRSSDLLPAAGDEPGDQHDRFQGERRADQPVGRRLQERIGENEGAGAKHRVKAPGIDSFRERDYNNYWEVEDMPGLQRQSPRIAGCPVFISAMDQNEEA